MHTDPIQFANTTLTEFAVDMLDMPGITQEQVRFSTDMFKRHMQHLCDHAGIKVDVYEEPKAAAPKKRIALVVYNPATIEQSFDAEFHAQHNIDNQRMPRDNVEDHAHHIIEDGGKVA